MNTYEGNIYDDGNGQSEVQCINVSACLTDASLCGANKSGCQHGAGGCIINS